MNKSTEASMRLRGAIEIRQLALLTNLGLSEAHQILISLYGNTDDNNINSGEDRGGSNDIVILNRN